MQLMKRVQVIADGYVQRVGYRDFVQKETFCRDITGYVKNLDDGKVEIIAEGSEEELQAFVSRINITKYPINVTECNVSWQESKEEFKKFEIKRGDREEETFERLDYAGKMLYEILEFSKETLDVSKETRDISRETLEVSKETLDNSRVSLRLQNNMLDKQDQMIEIGKETKDEIAELRTSTGKYLDEEFKEIRKELVSIKDALARAGIKV
ncbi:Acylphosphatase [Methanoplanus limicola DSM 2279]|uniref:acylphosphatase n=2 Tax=Methanoplanus limicola TaxID=2315 RepID=H1YZU1_9EURY|nr:Acylphosphatase [Methanoplanus limicola DSM 2279]